MLFAIILIYIITSFILILLFIVIPDFWIDSFKDNNILKRLMKDKSFLMVYILICTLICNGVIVVLTNLAYFYLNK